MQEQQEQLYMTATENNSYDRALEIVLDNQALFRPDFPDWMHANWHVVEAFTVAAEQIWNAGFTHYSARTIMEVIRHRSNVREISGEFKINNNQIPDLARLHRLMNPDRAGLFAVRSSDIRAAA